MKHFFITLFIWIICFCVITGATIMTYHWYENRGEKIVVSFQDASGLVPTQTKLYYRGVSAGTVTAIDLDTKNDRALVRIRLTKEAGKMIGKDSVFWIVEPEIDFTGLRNLNTIASGIYIEVLPVKGDFSDTFTGMDQAPPDSKISNGLNIVLDSANAEGLDVKAPVLYKGVKVGEITKVDISADGANAVFNVSIYAPYAGFVKTSSVFWITDAVNADINLFGQSKVDLEPLKAMLSGSISFISPLQKGEAAKAGQEFTLYSTMPGSGASSGDIKAKTGGLKVLLNSANVQGLEAGAPLVYKGVKAGSITKISISKDGKAAVVTAYIEREYVHLVNVKSVFWITNAVDADIHLFSHSSVQVEPLIDMLKGSISFASPTPDAAQVKSGAEFILFSRMPDIVKKADKAFETQ